MRAADGLRNDLVDQIEVLEILRREAKGLRGGLRLVRTAPKD